MIFLIEQLKTENVLFECYKNLFFNHDGRGIESELYII